MITKLTVGNFRSIKKTELDLGKITVLTGANNSGKSSIIYALLVLKNFVRNPNQSLDNCLSFPFINLGGFKQTVHQKDESLNIELGILVKNEDFEVRYGISLGDKASNISINGASPSEFKSQIDIALPYAVNKSVPISYTSWFDDKETEGDHKFEGNLLWNGIGIIPGLNNSTQNNSNEDNYYFFLNETINEVQTPITTLTNVDFVPIRRGFTKPYFSPVPLQDQIFTEDEIATVLSLDRDLTGRVAHYLEKIVDRNFSIYTTPGTAIFYLQTRDRATGFTVDLVNEGLGTNQLVTILTKVLYGNNKFICIDEPEIHLHPTIIDKLVAVLVEIAEEEDKQLLISTHSEHFISSLLTQVASKKIASTDVKAYYLSKGKKDTKIEEQAINDKGQISGGLKNFYAAELANLETLFKLTE